VPCGGGRKKKTDSSSDTHDGGEIGDAWNMGKNRGGKKPLGRENRGQKGENSDETGLGHGRLTAALRKRKGIFLTRNRSTSNGRRTKTVGELTGVRGPVLSASPGQRRERFGGERKKSLFGERKGKWGSPGCANKREGNGKRKNKVERGGLSQLMLQDVTCKDQMRDSERLETKGKRDEILAFMEAQKKGAGYALRGRRSLSNQENTTDRLKGYSVLHLYSRLDRELINLPDNANKMFRGRASRG